MHGLIFVTYSHTTLYNPPMTELKKENKKVLKKPQRTNPKFAEKVLIWSILVFGIIGLMVILDSMTFKKNETAGTSIYKGSIDDNRSYDTKRRAPQPLPIKNDLIKGKQLHVGGPREAHTPVLFEVENFNQNAEYLLDFGDGIRRVLNQRTDSHIYEMPGNYKLQLYVTYKGERRKLASKSIEIMEPITVATNATRIDF